MDTLGGNAVGTGSVVVHRRRGGAPLVARWQTSVATVSTARVLLRLILATVFLVHGGGKLFGPMWFGGGFGIQGTATYFESVGVTPGFPWAVIDGLAEFGAGVLLLLGLLVPLAALIVVIDMLVAMMKVTGSHGFIVDKPGGGFELNLLLLVVAIAVGLLGAGPLSLDGVFGLTTGGSHGRDW